jgi:hypothetical protein
MNLPLAIPVGSGGDNVTLLHWRRQSSLSELASLLHERGRWRLRLAWEDVAQDLRVFEVMVRRPCLHQRPGLTILFVAATVSPFTPGRI